MWSDLAVVGATVACSPPYSFYFDLIEKVWKTKAANNLPLHRLCTLARKQGARAIILEPAARLPHVAQEIDELDRMHAGGGGAAEAIAISFFACDIAEDSDLADVAEGAFLGQAIIINYRPPGRAEFEVSYVFEGILPPPTLSRGEGRSFLLNNYLAPHHTYQCTVRDRTFTVEGVYYCQQNSLTHVCAHACLHMALRTSEADDLTTKQINDRLGITPPCQGLSLGQIVDVIESRGLEADVTEIKGDQKYMPLLASIIESGDQALLIFRTGNGADGPDGKQEEHVVLVFGHTRHSDEWHPQAIPVYAGPGSSQYLQASAWIDHFLIHDDNLGPYYTLSSQALEFDPDVSAHWIIAIRQKTPNLTAEGAEAIAALMLTNLLPVLATSSSGRWFDYITQNTWRYVLRTILLSREDYLEHLRSAHGHDESSATAEELEVLSTLPERIWMVEFTLPSLFTGNRAKLGEVLLMADSVNPDDVDDVFLGLRLPNLLVVKNPQTGEMVQCDCSLQSHSALFRRTNCGVEW
jgi:hypothetical protein